MPPKKRVPAPDQASPLAALDLGSNSFHLIVARELEGHWQIIDRHRERVALGDGLDENNRLKPEAQIRALASLQRFAQRIWDVQPARLRVVGTNTLRVARDAEDFLRQAEAALGAPIEIISGLEEARLTWLGVTSGLPSCKGRRLLVDIGGGSTECILGDGEGIHLANSLQLGCVAMSKQIFADGKLTKARFRNARALALAELQTISEDFRALGWVEAYGSSGTINTIAKYLPTVNREYAGGITPQALEALEAHLCDLGNSNKLEADGVRPDRVKVIAGGLAVLRGVFESLGVTSMQATPSALREGVLQDLLGRIHHQDVRQRAIHGLMWLFRVDFSQAHRVAEAAAALIASLPEATFDDQQLALLRWAAQCHEVGLSLSYSGYQKHSAYVALNAELDGFSRSDQRALAFLLLNHRRRLRPESDNAIVTLEKAERWQLLPLAMVLRLAVLLMRSRRDHALQEVRLEELSASSLKLRFPKGWLKAHPLAALDLAGESQQLSSASVAFSFAEET